MLKSNRIIIKDAVLSYPHLIEVQKSEYDKVGKFTADFLLDPIKNKESIELLEKEINLLKKAAKLKADSNSPLKSGDEKFEKNPKGGREYAGLLYLKASSRNRPRIIDIGRKDIPESRLEELCGGCIVNAAVTLSSYSVGNICGVVCYMQVIQYVDEGTRFGDTDDVSDFPNMENHI